MKHIVKRRGHTEVYDDRKVYASVYSAALNCHYTESDAEKIAKQVTTKVNSWIKARETVTSHDIKGHIVAAIDDEDVAMMYQHHLDVC